MVIRPVLFASHAVLALSLLTGGGLFGDGLFSGWFSTREGVDSRAVQAALQERWASADPSGRLLVSGLRMPLSAATAELYAARRFAPLWTDNASRDTLLARLAQAQDDGLDPSYVHTAFIAQLRHTLARLNAEEHGDGLPDHRPAVLADLDLLLTDGLLRYADALLGHRVDPSVLYPDLWYPTHRTDAGLVLDAVARGDAEATVAALDALQPIHPEYAALRTAMERLREAEPFLAPIPAGAPLRVNEVSVRVPYLRSRLAALGYLAAPSGDPRSNPERALSGWGLPDPLRLDSTLAGALARFQADQHLAPDSVLSNTLLPVLNIEADVLMRTVALNMERWRWLPDDLGSLHVLANLPAYELMVRNRAVGGGWREALRMPAAIGAAQTAGWTTPILTDTLEAVVFHPTWYLPVSLQSGAVFNAAQRGFRLYANGTQVDPTTVDWETAEPGQFRVEQAPGRGNPLGRIKFVMPNEHAVLIHDTNKPWNFERDRRALSSGCVQASDAPGLARVLLRFTNQWPDDAVEQALRRGYEQVVPLDRPVFVHFLYFTAWPEADGRLRLYEDVYGYDATLAQALSGRSPLTDSAS